MDLTASDPDSVTGVSSASLSSLDVSASEHDLGRHAPPPPARADSPRPAMRTPARARAPGDPPNYLAPTAASAARQRPQVAPTQPRPMAKRAATPGVATRTRSRRPVLTARLPYYPDEQQQQPRGLKRNRDAARDAALPAIVEDEEAGTPPARRRRVEHEDEARLNPANARRDGAARREDSPHPRPRGARANGRNLARRLDDVMEEEAPDAVENGRHDQMRFGDEFDDDFGELLDPLPRLFDRLREQGRVQLPRRANRDHKALRDANADRNADRNANRGELVPNARAPAAGLRRRSAGDLPLLPADGRLPGLQGLERAAGGNLAPRAVPRAGHGDGGADANAPAGGVPEGQPGRAQAGIEPAAEQPLNAQRVPLLARLARDAMPGAAHVLPHALPPLGPLGRVVPVAGALPGVAPVPPAVNPGVAAAAGALPNQARVAPPRRPSPAELAEARLVEYSNGTSDANIDDRRGILRQRARDFINKACPGEAALTATLHGTEIAGHFILSENIGVDDYTVYVLRMPNEVACSWKVQRVGEQRKNYQILARVPAFEKAEKFVIDGMDLGVRLLKFSFPITALRTEKLLETPDAFLYFSITVVSYNDALRGALATAFRALRAVAWPYTASTCSFRVRFTTHSDMIVGVHTLNALNIGGTQIRVLP